MAAPVVATSATVITDATNTTCVVPKPSGVASGDLLIAYIETSNAAKPTALPTGWTEISDQNDGFAAGTLTAYRRVADGSEGASFTWTVAGSYYTVGACLRITGQHATLYLDASTKSGTGSSATQTSPSVTSTTTNCLLIRACGDPRIAMAPATPPASHTEVVDIAGTAAFDAAFLTIATISQAGAGASGTADFAMTGAYAASHIVLAIAPAAGGGTTWGGLLSTGANRLVREI